MPATILADNGYATRADVEQTSAEDIELVAPCKDDASREAGACARNGIASEFQPSAFKPARSGRELLCPAGKSLVFIQQKMHHGVLNNVFEARSRDCKRCRWRKACCGQGDAPRRIERVLESASMKAYLARMKRPEMCQLYRKRSQVAEFPHLWAKGVKK